VSETAEIKIGNDSKLDCPIVVGTENERGIDIAQLRAKTGVVVLDPAFMNTASTKSAITYLDGDKGILRYRGIPIEQLAEKSSFVETAYLLLNGELPTEAQLKDFSEKLRQNAGVDDQIKRLFDGFPKTAHPMAKLSALVVALSAYYADALDVDDKAQRETAMIRLLAKLPTLAAWSYKHSVGQAFVAPNPGLSYAGNFLNMVFSDPSKDYRIDPDIEQAINLLFILHADHEQNCSTSAVRLTGSSKVNLYAAISAGISALWGPLHGGANQEVIEMLMQMHAEGGDVKKWVEKAKDKNSGFRLMGFGHRVYKNFDPRAKIIKVAADKVLGKLGIKDPLLDLAKGLEEAALKDSYFIDRKLYPNVDFYSGIIYRALGFPTDMFTVLFALGRLPGWMSQWKEQSEDPSTKIGRPRQIYTGHTARDYVSIENRAGK
jgi:citrate synthase